MTNFIDARIDGLLEVEKHLQEKEAEISLATGELKDLKTERDGLIAAMREKVIELGQRELVFKKREGEN